jgi:hypothetical protein
MGNEGDLIAVPRIAVNLKKGELKLNFSPYFPRQILLDFDFIQPNDGMLIELLYSGKPEEIKITGTIIDMKAQIVSAGELYKQNKVKYLPITRVLRVTPFLIILAFLIFLANKETALAGFCRYIGRYDRHFRCRCLQSTFFRNTCSRTYK